MSEPTRSLLGELAEAGVMDGDTEDALRNAADRVEQCRDDAQGVLDAIARAEAKIQAGG
jgi:hypothetical protein